MSTHNYIKRASILLVVSDVAGGAFLAGRWWFPVEREVFVQAPTQHVEVVPTCRIEFLPPAERIARMNAPIEWPEEFVRAAPTRLPPPHQVPIELADNPILLREHFATVRFENQSDQPLLCYVLLMGWNRAPRLENIVYKEVEIRDSVGNVLPFNPNNLGSLFFWFPLQSTLEVNQHPVMMLRPGRHVNVPLTILCRNTPPGEYTIRAIVSYAEAPSGERKQIMSEPVQITVTEEHIKAAEAYWAERAKN